MRYQRRQRSFLQKQSYRQPPVVVDALEEDNVFNVIIADLCREDRFALLPLLTPRVQYRILGEHLHPRVEMLEFEKVDKITGMLLELPIDEILHLIRTPDALGAKVVEALDVLKSHEETQNSANQNH